MPRRKNPHDIKPSPSDRYLPFAQAAHTLATKIFGPNYPQKLKNLPETEILRTLIRHMYDKEFRKRTGVEDPIDVEMVNLLRGKRLPTPTHPLDDIYDPYVRDRETGDFTLPHSTPLSPTRAPYKASLYPLSSFFHLLKLYHRNDKKLNSKLETLSHYATSIDAFLPHPDDYPVSGNLPRPLLDELINSLPDLHPFELFTHQNYDTHAKPWIEKLEENYKTRAPHTALTVSLALLSKRYKDLHYISRYANYLDHLHRANLLNDLRTLAKSISSPNDIFRIITTHPDLIEKITTTDTPHQALATSLALLSSLHKDLHYISRNANYLDHLHRAGILPLVRELAKSIKNKEDIFRIITTHPDLIEKITTTDTPHQALAISLALLSSQYKDLQSISRHANKLDHLHRANLLNDLRTLAKSISSPNDIFRIITTHPDLIEKITTTDAPHTALAVSLALLSGLHKDLHYISRYANTLDHIALMLGEILHTHHNGNTDAFLNHLREISRSDKKLTIYIPLDEEESSKETYEEDPTSILIKLANKYAAFYVSHAKATANMIRGACSYNKECEWRSLEGLVRVGKQLWMRKQKKKMS